MFVRISSEHSGILRTLYDGLCLIECSSWYLNMLLTYHFRYRKYYNFEFDIMSL